MPTNNLPAPRPDPERYDRILQKGLATYPERRANYEAYRKGEPHLPIKLDIENVSRCNLKCPMCQVAGWKGQERAADMSLTNFRKLIDEQYGLVELKIQGMGEPFMSRDFVEMVEYAASRHLWVRTSTNATLLNVGDNYRRVIEAGIGEVQISMDGTNREMYESIRINASFEKVVQNCKLINTYCNARGLTRTRLWFLLQKANFHQVGSIPEFAESLGFRRFAIITDLGGWGDEEWIRRNKDLNVEELLGDEEIGRLLSKAEQLDLEIGFWGIYSKFSRSNPCPWPFERAYVSSDMRVVPCCMIANPDTYELGQIKESFTDVWRSATYERFREMHRTGQIPPICRSCYE